jgi:hypothetical protein
LLSPTGAKMSQYPVMADHTEHRSRRKPPQCTACASAHTRRSQVRWFERPLVLLRYRPYRCEHCKTRFWLFRW